MIPGLSEDLLNFALTLGTLVGLSIPCLASRMPRDSTLGSLQRLGFPFNMTIDILDKHFSFSAKNVKEGRYYTCLTCLFNHGDTAHFNGNMTVLLLSGYFLHKQYGRKHMLASFFGGGISGCIAQFSLYLYQQIRWENILPSPKTWSIFGHTLTTYLAHWQKSVLGYIFTRVNAWLPCIGCSAGLAGLIAVQACFIIVAIVKQNRRSGIRMNFNLFFQLLQLLLALDILQDIYVLVGSAISEKNMLGYLIAYSGDGIGHEAHLGGFVFGFLYYFLVIYNRVTPKDY